MSIGLFIGRFQPFHLGHLSAVKQALKQVDFLVIGIGSSQYSHKSDNPFTAEERKTMIKKALEENGIKPDQYEIINLPDIHSDPEWPGHVMMLTPEFEVVFTLSDIIKKLFEKHTNIEVKPVNVEINISATEIRKKMLAGENWKEYLSSSTVTIVEKINGVNRTKKCQEEGGSS